MIYQSGKLSSSNWAARQNTVEAEERERGESRQRKKLLQQEDTEHAEEVRKIRGRSRERVMNGTLSGDALREYNEAIRSQLLREERRHTERVLELTGVALN